MLRVLIVEDQHERQEILKKLLRDHAWVMAHTAARAVRLIQAYPFDLVMLDHDLAGPEKGDTVAAALAGSASAETAVFVHSMNAPGAKLIRKHVPHAIEIPISRITRDNATFKRLREQLALMEPGGDVDWAYVFRTTRTQ